MAWIDQVIVYSAYGLGIVALTLVIMFFIFMSKYKHTVIIRRVTNNRKFVTSTKARTFVDKDGTKWWKILKAETAMEKKLPYPPESAIEIDRKGRLFAEAHQSESGEYYWIDDDVQAHTLKTIPATHKITLANQIRKAEEERNTLFQKHFATFLIGGFVLMGLALVLLFGGDLLEPLNEMGDKFTTAADRLGEALEKQGEIELRIAEIENDVQTLGDSDEFNNARGGDSK